MREFHLALTFLTTVPLPTKRTEAFSSAQATGRAFAWYPLVGLLIGLLLAGAAWLLAWTPLAATVQAGLLLLLWTGITGGLHLDGVMDSCDALFAPVSVERRLAILKDVHTGAFGVIGLFFVLGLKWTLLADLLDRSSFWPALLLAPLWGRWMLVWAAQRFPYARSDGSLGSAMTAGLSPRELWIASLCALLVQAALGVGQPLLFGVLLAPLTGLFLARWAASKLGGGLTGDLYGFLCETTELLALLALGLLGGVKWL
ncbi:MAG: adenosylcobinamide-GDP ribazoletransferase [Chloroflexi bacterium]|nr:MAG: adenosylcobinamide-GDP ribazoletransferase [Chloroflexota bacterium]